MTQSILKSIENLQKKEGYITINSKLYVLDKGIIHKLTMGGYYLDIKSLKKQTKSLKNPLPVKLEFRCSSYKKETKDQLNELVKKLWQDLLAIPGISPETLKKNNKETKEQVYNSLQKNDAKTWNSFNKLEAIPYIIKKLSCKENKLSSFDLSNTVFDSCNFSNCTIDTSKINKTRFKNCTFEGTAFVRCKFAKITLNEINLNSVDLENNEFYNCSLSNLDISSGVLDNNTFEQCSYDETTTFPDNYSPSEGFYWTGKGIDPRKLEEMKKSSSDMTVEQFVDFIQGKIDSSRIAKSLKMLKKDSFKLFTEIEDNNVVGVIKSQTDLTLVYSCHLDNTGSFSCCTQNLNPCGGLRGNVCKHILVLVIGLVNAGELNPSEASLWIEASTMQEPNLDKDAMSEILIKYKGAETGEIDWRPTETVPEDFYAL